MSDSSKGAAGSDPEEAGPARVETPEAAAQSIREAGKGVDTTRQPVAGLAGLSEDDKQRQWVALRIGFCLTVAWLVGLAFCWWLAYSPETWGYIMMAAGLGLLSSIGGWQRLVDLSIKLKLSRFTDPTGRYVTLHGTIAAAAIGFIILSAGAFAAGSLAGKVAQEATLLRIWRLSAPIRSELPAMRTRVVQSVSEDPEQADHERSQLMDWCDDALNRLGSRMCAAHGFLPSHDRGLFAYQEAWGELIDLQRDIVDTCHPRFLPAWSGGGPKVNEDFLSRVCASYCVLDVLTASEAETGKEGVRAQALLKTYCPLFERGRRPSPKDLNKELATDVSGLEGMGPIESREGFPACTCGGL